jgi:hypothetical protein
MLSLESGDRSWSPIGQPRTYRQEGVVCVLNCPGEAPPMGSAAASSALQAQVMQPQRPHPLLPRRRRHLQQ